MRESPRVFPRNRTKPPFPLSTSRAGPSPISLSRGSSPSISALRIVAGERRTLPARPGSACEPSSDGWPKAAGRWGTSSPPHACMARRSCWYRPTRRSRSSVSSRATATSRTSSGRSAPRSARRRRNTADLPDTLEGKIAVGAPRRSEEGNRRGEPGLRGGSVPAFSRVSVRRRRDRSHQAPPGSTA